MWPLAQRIWACPDVAVGLKKLGMARPERLERVRWAREAVGLDFETFKDRYTFPWLTVLFTSATLYFV